MASIDYNRFMIWLRNGVVYLLSLVLFVALLFGVIATTINVNLAKPTKIEAWLSQSGLYSSVIDTAVKQAQQQTGDQNGSSNGVSLSDVAVQQAAKTAFAPAVIQKDVNIVLDANYAWLEGKTPTPQFTIDLTQAKQTFAQLVGQYVTAHLAGLKVCTVSQAAAAQSMDPLTVTCRPANVNAKTAGTDVTQKLASGDGFLSNPVITATTINPKNSSNNANSQPYYAKLSQAPKVYQAASMSPWVFAGVVLLSALGVLFISVRKRKGLRRIGVVLVLAGLVLVGTKFAADAALKQLEKHAFNNSNIGDIQNSLTNFAQVVESHIANMDMYFGIAFLVAALLIFIVLIATKGRDGKRAAKQSSDAPQETGTTPVAAQPKPSKPVMDITGKPPAKPAGQSSTAPTLPAKPSSPGKPKRPRLIQ